MSHPLTVVIKLGSSSILQPEPPHFPQIATLSALAETCVSLRSLGHRIVIVSSGAIGMGLHRMELPALVGGKKRAMGEKQALAAIGQGRLIALWDQIFGALKQPIAQILLTRNDIADRSRYLNATTTLSTLLSLGVIPIINENDTISVSEILHINKFGDNDTLSAIAAGMCGADYLFLLTDVDGLYEDNPRRVPGARRVTKVRDIEEVRKLVSTSTLGTSLGTGGMETKLIAAELATAAGCATVITLGSLPSRILPIVQGHAQRTVPPSPNMASSASSLPPATTDDPTTSSSASRDENPTPSVLPGVEFTSPSDPNPPLLPPHTLFTPKTSPLSSRRFWVLHGLTPRGTVYIDEGAYRAISRGERDGGGGGNGGRLLAAGVVRVEGTFAAGQAVRVCVVRRRGGNGNGKRGTSSTRDSSRARDDKRERRKSRDSTHSVGGGGSARVGPERPVSPDHFADREWRRTAREGGSEDVEKRMEKVHFDDAPAVFEADGRGGGRTPRSSGDVEEEVEDDDDVFEFGRGLTNYNSSEIDRVKGLRSSDIEKVLGYYEAEHVVESVVELGAPHR
ncbi:hypothetical protein JCM10212_000763 [Sporobolomyces blumeae]